MKLVITFTNYWEAFGGMGQYVKWYQMSHGKSVGNSKVDEKDTCDFTLMKLSRVGIRIISRLC